MVSVHRYAYCMLTMEDILGRYTWLIQVGTLSRPGILRYEYERFWSTCAGYIVPQRLYCSNNFAECNSSNLSVHVGR